MEVEINFNVNIYGCSNDYFFMYLEELFVDCSNYYYEVVVV